MSPGLARARRHIRLACELMLQIIMFDHSLVMRLSSLRQFRTPFERSQRLCRAAGTLFVCDEVQTGFGRTGR